MTRYRRIRNKSLILQDKLSGYILVNDKLNDTFTESQTYGEYLNMLQHEYGMHLGEKTFRKIQAQKRILPMNQINRRLDAQEQRLLKIERELYFLKDIKESPAPQSL